MTEIKSSESMSERIERAKSTSKNWYGEARLSQYLLLFAAIAAILAVVLSLRGEYFLPVIREAFEAILAGF